MSALMATLAGEKSPLEKASWIRWIVPTVGALFGSASRPLCDVWMCRTGRAITTTAVPASAATCGTLFTLSLEVEERVVDADREADEQDDGVDVLIHRNEVARQCDEPDRRQHAREGEQQRNAHGDEGAEDEEQDDERDR